MIVGESRTTQVTFRDQDGTLVDPSSVTLTIRDPEGTVTTPTPDNPSTGVYEHEIDFDEAGWWRWQWSGTTSEGTVIAECQECVEPSSVVAVG